MVWVIIILVGVVAIVCAVVAHAQEKKRREMLAAFAREQGWSFDPSSDPSHRKVFGYFEVFARGHSQRAFNTMTGWLTIADRRYAIRAGDYEYKITTSNGKSTSTHTYRLSYLILQLPFPNLPSLFIRPEGFLDKLAGAFGFDDIDFESAEFSRKFYVKSSDRKFAYAVVHPRMMEILMRRPGPAIDLQRGHLCIQTGNRRWEPSEFLANLGWAAEFLAQWPSYLTHDLESRSSM